MGLIFITGMPGAGKSAVGEIVARELGVPFFDLDREIERRVRKTVAQIFADDGEPAFRSLEASTLADLCHRNAGVIALGAGALERDESFARVKATGFLVYLRCHLRLLVERTRSAIDRPLLADSRNDADLVSRLVTLFRRRRRRYAAAKVIVNEFRARTSVDMASEVLTALKLHAAV